MSQTKEYYEQEKQRIAEEKKRREDCFDDGWHYPQKFLINNEEVEIDEHMVPTIKWLNSIRDARSLWCCQGSVYKVSGGSKLKPYVSFLATGYAIEIIVKTFHQFLLDKGEGIEYFRIKTRFFYCRKEGLEWEAEWYDRVSLQDFNEWLKTIHE